MKIDQTRILNPMPKDIPRLHIDCTVNRKIDGWSGKVRLLYTIDYSFTGLPDFIVTDIYFISDGNEELYSIQSYPIYYAILKAVLKKKKKEIEEIKKTYVIE